MNQDYRGRVKRFLEAGGDPKYVNVKRKAEARHAGAKSEALEKAKGGKISERQVRNRKKENPSESTRAIRNNLSYYSQL